MAMSSSKRGGSRGGNSSGNSTGGAKRSSGGNSSSSSGKSSTASRRRASSRRELINTGTDKRFVRRSAGGQFKESDDVGRSLSADRKRKARTVAKPGQGDRGDRKRS